MLNTRLTHLLGAGTVPALVLAGAVAAASPAGASATPALTHAVQTVLCANTADHYCGQTLTASIPAGSGLEVICSRHNDYYIEVLAHRNQEGYVPKSDVSSAPTGLADCNTPSHPAIYAGANAIGYLGTTSPYGPGTCLAFVIGMWRAAGASIGSDSSQTAASWWSSSYNHWTKETKSSDPSRYLTPPRGAMVFWGPNAYTNAGHVAISMGNGWLVSTQEGNSTNAVHLVTIAQRNAEPGHGPYLGWVMPKNG